MHAPNRFVNNVGESCTHTPTSDRLESVKVNKMSQRAYTHPFYSHEGGAQAQSQHTHPPFSHEGQALQFHAAPETRLTPIKNLIGLLADAAGYLWMWTACVYLLICVYVLHVKPWFA